MGNESNRGIVITPLVLTIVGVLCAVLAWIGLTGLMKLDKVYDQQAAASQQLATIITSQSYDRKELDAVKGEVRAVQVDVRGLADRLGKVEARR
jgi:cell division protein FtsB